MINFSQARITRMAVHRVGNKSKGESLFASAQAIVPEDDMQAILLKYFLRPFAGATQTYRFVHPVSIDYNALHGISEQVFEEEETFYDNSVNILRHLYEQSAHPHIKSGDLFIALFDEILLGDEVLSGIGIFKSENKDAFLQLTEESKQVWIRQQEGISLRKLDKGCVILNTAGGEGFRVFTVDNNNYDAEYWRRHFLNIDFIKDDNFDTQSYLEMCTAFAHEVILPKESKKEQLDFLNQSIQYFDSNEQIASSDFQEQLFPQEELRESFSEYKAQYETDHEVTFPEVFNVSRPVLKKQKRAIKNFIKLDTNIQIKLDFNNPESGRHYIEQGFDEAKGMRFYKIFYNEELD